MKYFLLFAMVLGPYALADWSKIPSKDFVVKNPPEPGSQVHKKDFEELHRLEDSRTSDDCELSAKQEHPTFNVFFAQSEILTKAEVEESRALVQRVMKFSVRVASYFKNRFTRERPFNVDTTLKPCVKKPGGNKAYPSSHAVAATTGACVLAKIYPDKADELESHGDYLGRLRAIVGVHHPSDVKAGQKLGEDICERLLSEDDFKSELP